MVVSVVGPSRTELFLAPKRMVVALVLFGMFVLTVVDVLGAVLDELALALAVVVCCWREELLVLGVVVSDEAELCLIRYRGLGPLSNTPDSSRRQSSLQ